MTAFFSPQEDAKVHTKPKHMAQTTSPALSKTSHSEPSDTASGRASESSSKPKRGRKSAEEILADENAKLADQARRYGSLIAKIAEAEKTISEELSRAPQLFASSDSAAIVSELVTAALAKAINANAIWDAVTKREELRLATVKKLSEEARKKV